MDYRFDKHTIRVMEKSAEMKNSSNVKRDLLLPFILVVVAFGFGTCLLMTWQTLKDSSNPYHYGKLEIHNTIVEKLIMQQQPGQSSTDQRSIESLEIQRESKSKALLFSEALLKNYNLLRQQIAERRVRMKDCPSNYNDAKQGIDPEINMTTCQMVNYWGYQCESHRVTTDDGYILTMHRIPRGKKNHTTKGYPVFLQHGLLSSSGDWVDNPPNISLAYILADNGYDVWMGNFRGNFYSRNHTTLSPDKRPFWKFSWDEMAHSDLPAMLHYVLNATGSADLYYAGHSQGTMTAFAEFSQNQELGHRVRMFFALAPVTTVGHMTDVFFLTLAPFVNIIRDILLDTGFTGEFLPRGVRLLTWLNENICVSPFLKFICEDTLWVIAGIHCNELNTTRLPVYISQTPAGTSLQNMVHFGQLVESKNFQMYDYGSASENQKHYNQTTPPLYDVSQIKTPLALYWGGKDWLADTQDVLGLLKKVHHVEHTKFIPNYDHLDFLWAPSAPDMLYNDMVNVMNNRLKSSQNTQR